MFYAKFPVPVTDTTGRDVRDEAWAALESHLLDAFGGFQQDRTVAGAWRSDAGEDVYEESRVYVVALASLGQVADFLAAVEWARQRFAQAAMFVEVAGIPEVVGPP